ncbi:MAG: hypothetical protein ACREGI_03215 [Candidatus Levyibacteriota bacterium]
MRKNKKRLFRFLFLFFISIATLTYIIFSYPPRGSIQIIFLSIPVLILFFLLAFFSLFSAGAYFLKSTIQGFVIGIFSVAALFLKYVGLTQALFFILLFILFILIELVIIGKKS